MSFSPVRLNHAVLFVADLARAETFYTEVFGMVVVAREPRADAAFLRLPRSGNHHDLGLFAVGPAAAPKVRGGVGLYHLAWQLDTIDELIAARQAVIESDAYTGESSHGATKSVYGADPDGNEFEVMWMLPRAHRWAGRVRDGSEEGTSRPTPRVLRRRAGSWVRRDRAAGPDAAIGGNSRLRTVQRWVGTQIPCAHARTAWARPQFWRVDPGQDPSAARTVAST